MSTRRVIAIAAAILGILIVAVAIFPSAASAQFFDPTTSVAADYPNWVAQASGWARRIYIFLLVFEIIAIALTAVLFRDNLGELFGTVGFKIFVGGVYMWFVANAGVGGWPQAVINTFKYFGIQLGGNASPTWLGVEGLGAAYAYFQSAGLSKKADDFNSQIANMPPNCTFVLGDGYCDLSIINAAATEHAVFQLVCNGLALMIGLSIAAIFLQLILITIESYLVMGAGILFIGFAGSRFTMPFSQGYFSYMINVGVKLMVVYIVLGIEQQYMPGIMVTAGVTLLGQSSVPFIGQAALAVAAVGAFQVVIAAALIWTIPGFAASFLTGQSSVSGSAVLQQAASTFAGASQAMAQLGSAKSSQSVMNSNRSSAAELSNQQHGNRSAGHLVNETMGNPTNGQSFAPGAQVAASATSGSGGAAGNVGVNTGSGNVTISSSDTGRPTSISETQSTPSLPPPPPRNPQTGLPMPQPVNIAASSATGGRSLEGRGAESIRAMGNDIGAFKRDLSQTNFSRLTNEERSAIAADSGLSHAALETFGSSFANANQNRDLANAYAVSGIAQAAPRDIGQPTAVQVRISNPDKL